MRSKGLRDGEIWTRRFRLEKGREGLVHAKSACASRKQGFPERSTLFGRNLMETRGGGHNEGGLEIRGPWCGLGGLRGG